MILTCVFVKISAEYEFEDEAEERALLEGGGGGISAMSASSSPPVSEDDSDVDSLHSFHYSPKAVDMPSAIRLANRLYNLDGFKKSDVSRHLSKKYVLIIIFMQNLSFG